MTHVDSEQVRALKKRYQNSLVEKKAAVETQRQNLQNSHEANSADILNEVYEHLHKLAGSSGMYGYDQLSSVCRKIMAMKEKSEVLAGLDQLIQLLDEYC